jgi:GT2 family glycosyltransferase
MSSSDQYRPFAAPLIEAPLHPRCTVCVIIPARNEEAILPRTLDALRDQRDLANDPLDPASYEVVLLLNNCTDASLSVAAEYQAAHSEFQLHIAVRDLPPEQAHVGTARRLLMDTAWQRLRDVPHSAILSTDGDTVVAQDWIARNLAALFRGPHRIQMADVVGGVIHLFPDDRTVLERTSPGTWLAYQRDRDLQRLIAHLESILDPDPADPWPRHLEHFGASLACTPEIYARCGGLPPIKPLEDVAFNDELRKVGARIRHCPNTHIFTSARLDGRAEVGLSGQLRHWQREFEQNIPHLVDSAEWLEHRFRSIAALRRLNEAARLPRLTDYPEGWRSRIAELHAQRLATPRFLELLDCNALIEETFEASGQPRHAEIGQVFKALTRAVVSSETHALATR